MMLAEYLKYGGPRLQQEVFRTVRECWTLATQAQDKEEASQWPSQWKVGLTVPLWKRKHPKSNKNNWRGITLLSVGSKLVARICSARLQRWVSPWPSTRIPFYSIFLTLKRHTLKSHDMHYGVYCASKAAPPSFSKCFFALFMMALILKFGSKGSFPAVSHRTVG